MPREYTSQFTEEDEAKLRAVIEMSDELGLKMSPLDDGRLAIDIGGLNIKDLGRFVGMKTPRYGERKLFGLGSRDMAIEPYVSQHKDPELFADEKEREFLEGGGTVTPASVLFEHQRTRKPVTGR